MILRTLTSEKDGFAKFDTAKYLNLRTIIQHFSFSFKVNETKFLRT
jgi:hypothetical protein